MSSEQELIHNTLHAVFVYSKYTVFAAANLLFTLHGLNP